MGGSAPAPACLLAYLSIYLSIYLPICVYVCRVYLDADGAMQAGALAETDGGVRAWGQQRRRQQQQ
jgi:hypothetical protein